MRLHTYQAKSLDDIWLDDIPNIRNPAAAVQDLEYTASPERRIQEWDLPDGYSVYVNKYRVFHRQFTWMAYRDVLNDVRRGNVVLLKRHDSGDEMARVVTSSGALRGDLPVALHTRLSYLIRNQLHRPRYITGTINSKAAGRLLAAGGIYNGNPDGFRNTARQLGGDAPAGYDQVMNPRTKGLIIAGASVAAGLGIGRLNPTSEVQALTDLPQAAKTLPSENVSIAQKQLVKKFKHAVDFNVTQTPNAQGLSSYESALKSHIDDPLTTQITGKYRWSQDVLHYYNPETKLNVMTKPDGTFISGWKLSDTQVTSLTGDGNVF
ncbi:colicin D domain-containing protein [Mangrovibacter phragmitis]|uniref:colicin D domain-containing protein n=1 Tax=Mangrovibacter phragmitis TaxID=1691903 RepID=UPI003369D8C6